MKRLLLICILFVRAAITMAQYSVDYTYKGDLLSRNTQVIKSLFLGSPEIKIMNLKYTGAPNAIAYFKYPNGILGIQEGLIITTGSGKSTLGPNNSPVAGFDNHYPGDASLSQLAKAKTYDATVIEFDFVPVSEFISFKYVFASEEYLEFVGRGFNDVFGFFLSGPDIPEPVNLAEIANGGDIVSVNTINDISNPHLYIDNGSTKKQKGPVTQSPVKDQNLQFDGFTKVLKARYRVTPYKTYHIKLAIADVGDGQLDSAVYLEAKSFKAEGKIVPPPYTGQPIRSTDPNRKKKPLPKSLLIEFDFDSAEIPDSSRKKLYFVYKDIRDYTDIARLEIYGHTDYYGSDSFNQRLSERRVNSVINYLVRTGYPRKNIIEKKGYGENLPKADNGTDDGRQRNRRVEVKVVWSKP
jgi:outer membrane protein OmpA-like peptidoglycan-associated protein